MRSKLIVSLIIAGVFLVGGCLLYLAKHRPANVEQMEQWEPGKGAPQAPAPAAPAKPVSREVEKFRAQPPLERVKEFYQAESARIGAVDPDPKLTEERIRAVAAELKPEEVLWLEARAVDTKEAADARFFAAYMLALSQEEVAVPAMKAIALTPIRPGKHEGAVELERQIRAQATEGLSKVADKALARDALLEVEQGTNDEFIRDRAHRSLYAVETGKSVEDQDKEAMSKLLYPASSAKK
jgi:hypothetical protein